MCQGDHHGDDRIGHARPEEHGKLFLQDSVRGALSMLIPDEHDGRIAVILSLQSLADDGEYPLDSGTFNGTRSLVPASWEGQAYMDKL